MQVERRLAAPYPNVVAKGHHYVIELSEQVVSDINGSLMSGHPVLFCAVTPEGLPTVSFRGTAQVLSPDQLAFWVRKPAASTLVRSIAERPTVIAVYSNMSERRFYQFTGRARVVNDEPTRTKVYDSSPPYEQQQDPGRAGAAVVLDLDIARGRGADGPFQMTRA